MRTKYITITPHESTNSNKINNMQHSAAEDIADLYRNYIGTKNDVEVHNLMLPVTSDNLQSQIASLESEIDALESKTALHTFYSTSSIRYPSSVDTAFQCRHEYLYGEAVLPVATTEIEYHYIDPVTGNRNLITNIEDYVRSFITNNRYKPKVNEIHQNSHINAVDQKTNKMHLVKALAKGSDVDNIDVVYNLDTQEVRLFNTVRIYPLPEMVAAYKAISISGPSKSQATITDWSGTEATFVDDNNDPIEKARKKTFRFPDEEVNSLSVVLNTDVYTMQDGTTKEFIIGARLISLEYNTYLTEGYIGIQVDATGQSTVEQIIPVYEGEASNIEVFVFKTEDAFNDNEGYVLNGNASTIQSKPQLNIGTRDNIYILFKLTKHDNNTTPIIKGCIVKWAQ